MQAGVAFPWDLIIATVAGAVVGAVVGLPALRIRGFYLAFATLAAHFILIQLAQTYQSKRVGSGGFIVPLQFVNLSLVDQQRAWALVLACVAAVVLVIIGLLTRAGLGRTWRVIRDHEIIAGSLGIRVPQYKLGAFMVSSAFIALQGGLTAHLSGYVTSDAFTLSLAVSYVAMVLIGGSDSLLGSVVGAVIVISLPYLTSNVMDRLSVSGQYSAQVAEILYGALVVVFVIYSSSGIAGWLRAAYGWVTGANRPPRPTEKEPEGPATEPAGTGSVSAATEG
jgi:branched-chain amino acid transport system permease protein